MPAAQLFAVGSPQTSCDCGEGRGPQTRLVQKLDSGP